MSHADEQPSWDSVHPASLDDPFDSQNGSLPPSRLTPRQREIVALIARGLTMLDGSPSASGALWIGARRPASNPADRNVGPPVALDRAQAGGAAR